MARLRPGGAGPVGPLRSGGLGPGPVAGPPPAAHGRPARAPHAWDPRSGRPARPLVLRLLAGFGAFWWDFLVGETPELLVGVVGIVAVVGLLASTHAHNAVAVAALPVAVALLLAAWVPASASTGPLGALGRGRRRGAHPGPATPRPPAP